MTPHFRLVLRCELSGNFRIIFCFKLHRRRFTWRSQGRYGVLYRRLTCLKVCKQGKFCWFLHFHLVLACFELLNRQLFHQSSLLYCFKIDDGVFLFLFQEWLKFSLLVEEDVGGLCGNIVLWILNFAHHRIIKVIPLARFRVFRK